jgi:hypothetical protein
MHRVRLAALSVVGLVASLRRPTFLFILGASLWLLGARTAFSATWVLDPAGDDSAAGTAAAPWRSWGKFIKAMNAATIRPGDMVKLRPGRYSTCEGLDWVWEALNGPGGMAANPVTVTVDASQAGDVEVHGGARPGLCGVPAWTQARQCVSGAHVRAACDTNTECDGGTCTDMPGVYWTRSAADNNNSWYGGVTAGVAYQPSLAPGGAPKIYEILYAADTAQVQMPVFTPGHAQVFPYATATPGGYGSGAACTGSRTPWLCCTGAGAGTCSSSRIYVQTETGVRPDLAADSSFGPVEFPYMPMVMNQGAAGRTQHVTFTNRNNGRKFYFRWGLTGIFTLRNIDHFSVEDFEAGYVSRVNCFSTFNETGSFNASRFPRFIGGETYAVTGWLDTGSNVVRNTAWRRGKIHGSQGNEQVHFLGGPIDRFTTHLFEYMEFADGPFAVPNGTVGTTSTPNAYTNQVQKSWPPPGYEAWAGRFPTHWGPLGGGGNTDGAFISSAHAHTVRNSYFHDGGLISFFESGGSGNLIFENNVIDLDRMRYTDAGGSPGYLPNVLITYCGGPSRCGGLEGRMALAVPVRYVNPGVNGAIIRNNLFLNTYANAIRAGFFLNYQGEPDPPYAPATPPMIVNNTFHVKGDYTQAQFTSEPVPIVWLWKHWNAADGTKGIFKNNIFVRDTPSANNVPLLRIDPEVLPEVDIDYNNWGGQNGIWRLGNTRYTSFASYRSALQVYGATNESHSLYVDPQFVTPYSDLRLQPTSPSYQTGLDLSRIGWTPFEYDFNMLARPAGAWSMGAHQDFTGPIVTTTTINSPTTTTRPSTTTTSIITPATTSTTSTTTLQSPPTTTTTIPFDEPVALYTSIDLPPQLAGADRPVDLGVRFSVHQPAVLTAIAAYLASRPDTTYPVALYRADTAALLATGSFTGSGTGWHTAPLATPLQLEPGIAYVASYHTPHGGYAFEAEAFTSEQAGGGVLIAPASTLSAPNGLHRYGAPGRMPTLGFRSASYYVTPIVEPLAVPTTTTTTVPTTTSTTQRATSTTTSTTTTTLPFDPCVDPATGMETVASAIRVRRFSLSRLEGMYDLRANGRFPFTAGTDPTVGGLTLSVEDASGRRVLAQAVAGSALKPTRLGWELTAPVGEVESLDIDFGTTSVVVTMRAMLPVFSLVDAAGTPSGESGALRWVIRFGDDCPGTAALLCTTTAQGNLSCALH